MYYDFQWYLYGKESLEYSYYCIWLWLTFYLAMSGLLKGKKIVNLIYIKFQKTS